MVSKLKLLSNKIVLLNAAVVTIVAGGIATFACWNVRYTAIAAAKLSFLGEATAIASRTKASFLQMESDAVFLVSTPPVSDLMLKARTTDLADPLGKPTDADLRRRLETIFKSMLRARSEYTQLRYIGVADNALELVRVDRDGDLIKALPRQDLQEKANEPYVRNLVYNKLKKPFFSDITMNRENGQVDPRQTPTVRCIAPVIDDEGKIFGAVIVNSSYPKLVETALQSSNPRRDVYIVDSSDNFMTYSAGNNNFAFDFKGRVNGEIPGVGQVDQLPSIEEETWIADNVINSYRSLKLLDGTRDFGFGVLLQEPLDSLFSEPKRISKNVILVAILLVSSSVIVTVILAAWLTAPLRSMAFEIKKLSADPEAAISLPTEQEDEIGQLAVSFEETLSGLRESQSEARKLISQLEFSNHELSEFAYVASHDLKAPLRAIDNASRWLQEDLVDIDEDSSENLSIVRTRILRMERLLDDLLAYSRIDRVIDPDGEGLLAFPDLLRDAIGMIDQRDGIEVKVEADVPMVNVRRMPLQQILQNLLSNAIKHHDKSDGLVEIRASLQDGNLVIEVEDDGPGIPELYRAKVFEMFQTLKPRDEVEGSGMGLAIVQKHLRVVKGTIELESSGTGGSLFRVFWPVSNTIATGERESGQ